MKTASGVGFPSDAAGGGRTVGAQFHLTHMSDRTRNSFENARVEHSARHRRDEARASVGALRGTCFLVTTQ